MGQPFAANPPIEFVATSLRELRQAAVVVAATPDVVPGRDEELRRISASYDEWLMIAAEQVGVEVETLIGVGGGMRADVRTHLEHALSKAGWKLDG